MATKVNTKKASTKKASTKKASTKKVEKAPVETKTVEQPKSTEPVEQPVSTEPVEQPVSTEPVEQPVSTEPESVYVDEQGVVRVPEHLKQMVQAKLAKEEAREHKKYNKIQSLRTFKYKVYYGDASHEPGHHGESQKEFKNLQTAINWIAKEAKFFVEEGIERECYSIVLDDKLIAEY